MHTSRLISRGPLIRERRLEGIESELVDFRFGSSVKKGRLQTNVHTRSQPNYPNVVTPPSGQVTQIKFALYSQRAILLKM